MSIYGAHVQGEVHSLDDDTATIIDAPGAGKRLHIMRGVVSILFHIKTPAGYIYLSNGESPPTIYWGTAASADAHNKSYPIDFGDEGIELDENVGFYLGATSAPYARAWFIGYVR